MDTGTGSKKVPRQQEFYDSFHEQRAFLFASISLLSPARNSKPNSSGLNSKEITASQKWKSRCRVGFRVGWYNQPALSSMIQVLSSFYHPEGQLHPKADSQWTMIVGCWMAGVWATCFLTNIFFFTLSIYSWLHSLRCCARAFSSCGERGCPLSQCSGSPLRWLLLLRSTGSMAHRLQPLWFSGLRVQ